MTPNPLLSYSTCKSQYVSLRLTCGNEDFHFYDENPTANKIHLPSSVKARMATTTTISIQWDRGSCQSQQKGTWQPRTIFHYHHKANLNTELQWEKCKSKVGKTTLKPNKTLTYFTSEYISPPCVCISTAIESRHAERKNIIRTSRTTKPKRKARGTHNFTLLDKVCLPQWEMLTLQTQK